ncbi:hypothetical protein CHS0354_019069 [Potamilus streckersoni]|uniref:Coiled-coil domain-containing protein 12 n=1 Tax=Potamilus streckersoni TaxID=2493646 RepID=A0AAE0T793_9BIVA|nr:hypothetical protein CHS0354_019069 [Potamilus streckersoni]
MYHGHPMAEVGTLQDAALKRKERLKNLKNQQNVKGPDDHEDGDTESKKEKLPKPIFRSYRPQDESLKEGVLPEAKPVDASDKIQSHLEASKSEQLLDEVDLVNLAPRKPDWDLKRDVAKKLEKLERKTQRAIAELIPCFSLLGIYSII